MASRVRITHSSERKVQFSTNFAICGGRGQFTRPLKQNGANWDDIDGTGKALVSAAFDVEGTDHVRVNPYQLEAEVAELFTAEDVRRNLRKQFLATFNDRDLDFEYGDEILSIACEIVEGPEPAELFDLLKGNYLNRASRSESYIRVRTADREAHNMLVNWRGVFIASTSTGQSGVLLATMRIPGDDRHTGETCQFEYFGRGSIFHHRP